MSEIKFKDDEKIIQTIQDAVKVEILDIEDDQFTTRKVEVAPRRAFTDTLEIASLTGIIDYLNTKIDESARDDLFVQVEGPERVSLRNAVQSATGRRFTPVVAIADTPTLVFDRYIEKEQAMIMLQSRFAETPERAALLEQLGTIVAEEELRQEDDGVSQAVTTVKGLRRAEEKIVNPVRLRPFRTFTEVEQPEAPFIVRLRKDDDGIEVAIFEADGGAWRNTARQSIKVYIEKALLVDVPVIA